MGKEQHFIYICLYCRKSECMMKILVVDDEIYIREGLKQLLELEGHETEIACDGKEALRMIDQQQPDLVITDIIMPERDGVEVICKAKEKYPKLKIIAISGGGRISAHDYLKIAKQLGANSILTKPFSSNDLISEINRVCVA